MHEYDLAHGKVSHVKKMADRFLLAVENSLGQKLTIEFVLQRDAVAFRYLVPGNGNVTIRRELTGFRLPLNSTGVMQQYQEASKVSPAYEYYYEKVKASETDDGKASIRKYFSRSSALRGL
jgi:alpha-glucosidase